MPLPDFNGFNHPFTGRPTVMTDEDRLEQYAFTRDFVQGLDPRGYMEIQLTRSLSMDTWRLNRLRAVEENIFSWGAFGPAGNIDTEQPQAHHALAQARVFTREARVLNTLSLIEQRLQRSIHANLKLLIKLQDRRKADEQKRTPTATEPAVLTRAAGHATAISLVAAKQSAKVVDSQ
jgi:hypothetical protein